MCSKYLNIVQAKLIKPNERLTDTEKTELETVLLVFQFVRSLIKHRPV